MLDSNKCGNAHILLINISL